MSVHGLQQQVCLVYKARALCSQTGEQDRNRWIVGTLGLYSDKNQIQLIDYDEDTSTISYISYNVPNQVWNLSSCPSRSNWFFSVQHIADTTGVTCIAELLDFEDIQIDQDNRLLQPNQNLHSVGVISNIPMLST
jgi:hypothetical protein